MTLTEHIAQLKDTNILVSASAGAGKTTLLIKRLMTRILEDRVSVNQICALTFSEAAAHEMKDRLKMQLYKAKDETNDIDLLSFIQTQLTLVDTAMISTIHSFALAMIRDFSYVLNLDPQMSQNVLDDATQQLLFDMCCDEVIHHAMEHHPQELQEVQVLVSTSSFDFTAFKKVIQSIYKIRRLQLNPESFDEQCLSIHKNPLSFIAPILCEKLEHDIQEVQELLSEVIRLAYAHDVDMSEAMRMQEALHSFIKDVRSGMFQDVIKKIHTPWVSYIPTISDHPDYKQRRDELNKKLKDLISSYNDVEEHVYDIQSLVPNIAFVIDCVKSLTSLMHERKQKLNVIEFDDMERLAYNILVHPDFDVPAFYKAQYSDILIDEFQDTNDIQNAIITLISSGNNVFRVGDIKQSIYRFRGAKPQLMRSMIQDKTSKVFVLPHNYRSKASIVEFNNHVFKILMNVSGFSDVYLKDDEVSVGNDKQHQSILPVTYLKVNRSDSSSYEISSDDEEDSVENEDESEREAFKTKSFETAANHAKARAITKDIIDRHYNDHVPFKDICVLVKSHAQKDVLKNLFDEKGIPHFINSPQGFLKHPAITHVLMLANYCLFPNEYYLSGVLLSEYTPLSSDDVATLKLDGSLQSSLQKYHSQLAHSLESLRNDVMTSSLFDAIHMCCQFNGFYHQCDSQGKLNIDALIQKAVDFQNNHHGGLFAFLSSLEKLEDDTIGEAMDVALGDDVVKVMTIHKSKGLQFPIVYVFNDESTTIHASREPTIVDPHFGFTLRIKKDYAIEYKNLIREALLYLEKKAAHEEALRLWYVAYTRAEREMICVGMNSSKTSYSFPLNAFQVLRSKGINGLLSGLESFLSPSLLRIREVDDPHRSKIINVVKEKSEQIMIMPKVDDDVSKPIVLTPLNLSSQLKPFEMGSLIHKVLAQCVNTDHPIESIKNSQEPISASDKEGMMSFFSHPLIKDWTSFEKRSEYPLITQHEGRINQYYLDLLLKKDDVWIIIDFKTDRVQSMNELKLRYLDQCLAYDQALRPYAPTLKTMIYSIYLHDMIEIT